MVPSMQICGVDQAEQNIGHFTKIKDETSVNTYVKCEGGYVKIWQQVGAELCQAQYSLTYDCKIPFQSFISIFFSKALTKQLWKNILLIHLGK